jgi:hypothetical protein
MGAGELLIGQLEFYWHVHLRPRLDGLTDAEYFWEPAQPSWSLRVDETGRVTYELEDPAPDPPPVTTIAWRMAHIAVGCFAVRANTFFNDGTTPADADMFDPRQLPADLPATAEAGLKFLDHWYTRWHEGIRSLDDEALARPLGPKGGPYADDSMLALITHINRETIHHGAEICLLRDLWRARG